MKANIRMSRTAKGHTRKAAEWWRDNRPAAPGLFQEELEAAMASLSEAPDMGTVFIIAVWSAVRGRGPVLTSPKK